MSALVIFLLISVISFVGSLQPGPVNMTVLQITLKNNYRTGIISAATGALPEILYSILALYFADMILQHDLLAESLPWISGIVLLLLGIFTILKKEKPNTRSENKKKEASTAFIMGMLNPMLFTYWLAIATWMESIELLNSTKFVQQVAFVSGTYFGAFILLTIVVYVTSKTGDMAIFKNKKRLNNYIGLLYCLLAMIAFINYFKPFH